MGVADRRADVYWAGPAVRVAALGECMLEVSSTGDGAGATLGFGGDTLNTAVYLARSGLASGSVAYVTALGRDPFSDHMVDAWVQEGIDVSLVHRDPAALPGLYLISTDGDGERSFYYWRERSAARNLLTEARTETLQRALGAVEILYFSGVTAAIFDPPSRERLLSLVAALRAAGVRIAFDSNYRERLWDGVDEARSILSRIAGLTDIALLSADDEQRVFGDVSKIHVADRWRRGGAHEVVVTDGSRPAVVAMGDRCFEVPPERTVDHPVDTTAAGDAFNAAYLAARLGGLDPHEAARGGHALAARVVSFRGALIPRGADVAAGHPGG